MTELTNDDPLDRRFGRPVTEPTNEDRLGGPFGRPVTEPTAWVVFRRQSVACGALPYW